MPNALAINGAQSDKPVKATPLYVGRIFSGIWTNRSPLRDANTNRVQEKYYGPSGDAMIAGSNVEVTNRLTLSRRPGNPIYDNSNTYDNILAFDEFRFSKALSDAWGSQIEQIDTMVDTAAALYANNNGTSTAVWNKSASAVGNQSFMQTVGSQLYFGNGVDQKKFNESLFVRQNSNNSTLINNAAYPFMTTFTIDSNGNIQQLIGCQLAVITGVSIDANNTLTVTIANPLGTAINGATFATTNPPSNFNQAIGTKYVLWGLAGTSVSFLEGATIELSTQYLSTGGTDTTLIASFTHAAVSVTGLTGILQMANGVTSGVSDTLTPADATIISGTLANPGVTVGSSVPTWGSTVPSSSNNFEGSITVDGNAIWINRGTPTQNWGIVPPSVVPTYTASGTETGWAANTYYSIGSIYQDSTGYLWQITTAGVVGSSNPFPFVGTKHAQVKVDVNSVTVNSGIVTLLCSNPSTAYSHNEVLTLNYFESATFLNGQTITIDTTNTVGAVTTIVSQASTFSDYSTALDCGQAALSVNAANPTTSQADGAAVWGLIQTPTQTAWAASQHYYQGDFVKATPAGKSACFFQLNKSGLNNYPTPQPSLSGTITTYDFTNTHGSATAGYVKETYGGQSSPGSASKNSLLWQTLYWPTGGGTAPMLVYAVDGSGTKTGATSSFGHNDGFWAIIANIFIPAAGTYTFNVVHQSGGAFFSFDDVAPPAPCHLVSGTFADSASPAHTVTVINGYGSGSTQVGSGQNLCGTNSRNNPANTPVTDTATWLFTAPGTYTVEIDYVNWDNNGNGIAGEMLFQCNGLTIAVLPDESNPTTPVWPAFTTTGATFNATQEEIVFGTSDVVHDGSQYTWVNVGPVTDYAWNAGIDYTLPGTNVVDSNGNQEGAIETGYTGTKAPSWNKAGLNSITADNGTLKWINEGNISVPVQIAGKITATSAQGWIYALALVNTLDNTVSNIGPVSASTGPLVNGTIAFAPGAGLAASLIDPQADYVAIFRTTDGFTTELLVSGYGNSIYTVPLVQYMTNGYIDNTPDSDLDTEAPAAQANENTPPLPGAINLTYHLNRIFYSTGNTVFWTSGPNDPIGNGINGFGPLNYDTMPSLVKRLLPTGLGLMVFTVSDIYVIPDDGKGNLEPSYAWAPGIGISSYNALDYNGPEIAIFTTDSQLLFITPQAGMSIESIPIADQFALKTATPGQSWYPAEVYVTSYVSGQDMGWFVSDGTNGWFRLIKTPAPEIGMSWSPFATLANTGGCGAIKSVETSPGVHNLLVGPRGTGVNILYRNTAASTDGGTSLANGSKYPAYAVFGSYVLAQPGQVANVSFITFKTVRTGSPAVLGLLLDDALPYFTGSFEILKDWVNDPPELKPSRSWYTQRFYLSDMPDESAACTDLQILIQWPAEAAINELQTFTIFGSFVQEI